MSGYLQLAERLCADDGEADATAFNFGPAEAEARPVAWVVQRDLTLHQIRSYAERRSVRGSAEA